jgi:hypothetical protein
MEWGFPQHNSMSGIIFYKIFKFLNKYFDTYFFDLGYRILFFKWHNRVDKYVDKVVHLVTKPYISVFILHLE